MLLTDFFAQNVRGLGAQLHAKLAPGANELTPAPAHFARLLRTLFYAAGFDPDANFAAQPREPARAGFIFTHEGKTYRLLRDLGTGAAQLALKTTELQPIATEAPDVLQRLRAMGMPSAEAFDAIHTLSESDFPSRRDTPTNGRTRAEIEAAIAVLRAKPRVVRSTDALEFELDGLQKKKYGWEDLSQRRAKLNAEVEQWQARLAQSAWLEQLPADFAKRVNDSENAQRKRASELADLGEDDGEPPPAPTPLLRNWQFGAGLARRRRIWLGGHRRVAVRERQRSARTFFASCFTPRRRAPSHRREIHGGHAVRARHFGESERRDRQGID